MDLSELLEARQGRPTESKAALKIATFAVIPAAMLGLLAGTRLVGVGDPIVKLLLVCSAGAFVAGIGIALLVLAVYHLFGFRPVAILADALTGGFLGLLSGGMVALMLMWLSIVQPDQALWALLLIPLGTLAVPLFRTWGARS